MNPADPAKPEPTSRLTRAAGSAWPSSCGGLLTRDGRRDVWHSAAPWGRWPGGIAHGGGHPRYARTIAPYVLALIALCIAW